MIHIMNKCNPAIFFSKDLKLSVPASQRVWPEIFMLKKYDSICYSRTITYRVL
jgi:hypothetical protein